MTAAAAWRLVLAAFAAISAFGALNGWVLLQGEMPYAMARDGVFPAFLAKAGKRGTPVRAHVLSSALLTGLVLMNYAKSMADLFTFIALLATSASLFTYLFSALAALRLQQRQRDGGVGAADRAGHPGGAAFDPGPWHGAGAGDPPGDWCCWRRVCPFAS
ncbi:amino acid permease [Caulobacter segnis]